MTHREASTLALRKLGFTDEWIKEHHALADAAMIEQFGPGALADTNKEVQLHPGQTLEGYVDYLAHMAAKALFKKEFDPEGWNKTLADAKEKLRKEIEGN